MFIWPSEKLKAKIGKEAWKRAEKRYNDYCNKNNIQSDFSMGLSFAVDTYNSIIWKDFFDVDI